MRTLRIELILATTFYLFAMAVILGQGIQNSQGTYLFGEMRLATVIYFSFMGFVGWIVPQTFHKYRIELGIVCTAVWFFTVWCATAANIWIEHQDRPASEYLLEGLALGVTSAVFISMIVYELIKKLIRYLNRQQNPLVKRICQESLLVLSSSFVLFVLLVNIDSDLGAFWITSTLYLYIFYAFCTYWILPKYERNKDDSTQLILLTLLLSFLLYIPFGSFFVAIVNSDFGAFILTWIGLNIFSIPLIYYYFNKQKTRLAEMLDLKIELGNTSAGLQFLRSQINPHFLFNILNTLYGTALQENAEKTSNGIQKLGDMMRFMLHENNQEKILLAREIEYLNNYIEIQLLRTENSPNITVEYSIPETISSSYIAPMILIPFVENAFKHGISLQEKSWIKLSLKEKNGVIYFDIHNSIHRKNASDPESQQSGIGLENVRQRLEFIYPNRHEYSVREASHDFYVHLTIQL